MAFAGRPWELALLPTYDNPEAEYPVRTAAVVIGWACICIGIISLITRKRTLRMLIYALLGTVAGMGVGVLVASILSALGAFSRERESAVVVLIAVSVVIGTICIPLVAGLRMTRRHSSE